MNYNLKIKYMNFDQKIDSSILEDNLVLMEEDLVDEDSPEDENLDEDDFEDDDDDLEEDDFEDDFDDELEDDEE